MGTLSEDNGWPCISHARPFPPTHPNFHLPYTHHELQIDAAARDDVELSSRCPFCRKPILIDELVTFHIVRMTRLICSHTRAYTPRYTKVLGSTNERWQQWILGHRAAPFAINPRDRKVSETLDVGKRRSSNGMISDDSTGLRMITSPSKVGL